MQDEQLDPTADLIKKNKLSLNDKFTISENAWRLSQAGYSSMFIMVNDQVSVENLLKEIRNKGLVPHVCCYIGSQNRAMVEHSLGSIDVVTEESLDPLEWLARFICNLPLSEYGNSGVKSACLS